MHRGTMFLMGEVDSRMLGKEVKIGEVTREDTKLLKKHVGDFCSYFGFDLDKIFKKPFTKIPLQPPPLRYHLCLLNFDIKEFTDYGGNPVDISAGEWGKRAKT
jgi:hypothetical protein